MTWFWSCNCCVWVEATKCAGNTADYRVFVHQDNLPEAVKIFSYGGVRYEYNNCWRIDPNGPRVALPPGAHKVNPATTYDSCSECEDDVDEPPSDGGPGGGGGGPGGGGPGGPGGGGPGGGGPGSPGDGKSEFVKLVVCSEHAGLYSGPDLYTRPSDEERFVRLYGYCFRVPIGPTVDEVPDGAQYVYTGGSYDDCHDCAYGKKARICPDQEDIPGYDDAPEIWVRSRDLPEETIGFTWGSFCYELRASDPEEVVPIDAFILNPRGDFADCTECRVGIPCQPCMGEPDVGYEVWVEAKEAEAFSTTVFFRYRAVCYSLDPSATPSRIPFDARVVVPRDEFDDCDTCKCGERTEEPERGIKAHLCDDQDVAAAEDLWVLEEDIPADVTYFKRGGSGGTCYYVDPSDPVQDIPVGSLIARIDNTYENCFDCATGGGGPPGGGGGGSVDPPPPWWPPLPEENYYQLRNCETDELGGWVRENHVCGVYNVVPCDIRGMVFRLVNDLGVEDGCWEVLGHAQPEPPGPTWTHRLTELISSCDVCAPEFTQEWSFTDSGFIDGGQEGASRSYDDPGDVPASPWSVLNSGRSLRLDWENDDNCANHNPYTQSATATARIFVPRDTLMTVSWSGQGETQDPDFELMSLSVNGQLVGSAHAPGGGQGCEGGMGSVVSDPQPPQQVILAAGEHTLSISATTNDPLYHVGAWYRFDLSFSDLPEAP